jgi:hypothetical protein
MSVANGSPTNTRNLKDINFVSTTALPSGAANTNTNVFNLVQARPYPVSERFIVQIATTASASGNSINMNVVLQQTAAYAANGLADTGNWTNIAELAPLKLVPNATITNAFVANYLLPPDNKQFIRALAVGATNMGNLADANVTCQLLF